MKKKISLFILIVCTQSMIGMHEPASKDLGSVRYLKSAITDPMQHCWPNLGIPNYWMHIQYPVNNDNNQNRGIPTPNFDNLDNNHHVNHNVAPTCPKKRKFSRIQPMRRTGNTKNPRK